MTKTKDIKSLINGIRCGYLLHQYDIPGCYAEKIAKMIEKELMGGE